MTIIYRSEKGVPLTVAEIDGNFRDLDHRLKNLETHPQHVEGISHLEQEGDSVRLIGSLGRILGTVILPKVFPTSRGDWKPNTDYRGQDWVRFEEHVFACKTTHRSEEAFNPQSWEIII